MNLTIVGLILLLVSAFFFFKYLFTPKKGVPVLLSIAVFSELFLKVGYIASFGGFELNYDDLGFAVLFLYCTITFFTNFKLLKQKTAPLLVFFFILCFSLVFRQFSSKTILSVDHSFTFDNLFESSNYSLIPMKPTFYSIVSLLRSSAFAFTGMVVSCYINKQFVRKFAKQMSAFIACYIVLGLGEFFLNNFVSPTLVRKAVLFLFGNGQNTVFVPYYRAGLYSINLTQKEPSHVGQSLFLCSFLLLFASLSSKGKRGRISNFVWLVLAQLLSLLTLSLTSFLGTFIFVVFAIAAYLVKKKKTYLIIPVFLLVLLFVFVPVLILASGYLQDKMAGFSDFLAFYINNPFDYSIFRKYGGSVVFRGYSILNALQIFLSNPLLGCGIGTNTSMSAVIGTLSNIGILGVIAYIYMYKKILGKQNVKLVALVVACSFFMFVGNVSDIMYSFGFFLLLIYSSACIKVARQKNMPISSYISQIKNGRALVLIRPNSN